MTSINLHLIAAARPNFMKIAPLSHALVGEAWCRPQIVHTGQHYDANMSDAFFRDPGLPKPHFHLEVGSGTHAEQTGGVMIAYEKVAMREKPDWIVVVGTSALYVGLGSPGLPDVPHAGRSESEAARDGVEAMIARVEERLRAAPEDGNGWDVIAPIYLRMERYGQAAEAFANANRLLGETPKRLAGFAQAEILANNGVVNANAKIAAERLLAIEPGRLDARLWLALAKEQDGLFHDALDRLSRSADGATDDDCDDIGGRNPDCCRRTVGAGRDDRTGPGTAAFD